jgi:osmoprotectant transport system ATP-binding protein
MNEPVIEFQHVRKQYGETPVIADLSFTVQKGDFVTIIGASGCGKTTTLKMINALIAPTAGDILVQGKNVRNVDHIMLRRNIGYAIQGSVLFPHMTVEENIAYVPKLWNKKDKKRTEQAVDKWMAIVGLDPAFKDRYPAELSGGQQQRVGIARALAASPEILLMDEPFGAVDEITRKNLQDEIARIHRETGITVLFVTHDIKEALKLGTKIMVMNQGRIQQYASPDNLLKHPANAFVAQFVRTERHFCTMPEDKIGTCAYNRIHG